MTNAEAVSSYCKKLNSIMKKAAAGGNYNKALSAASSIFSIEYFWNQKYVDKDAEKCLVDTAEYMKKELKLNGRNNGQRYIMFYDSFGLDLRGLAAIYLRALLEDERTVVYVTTAEAVNRQSVLKKMLTEAGAVIEYVDMRGDYMDCIRRLYEIYRKYTPEIAFEYNQPWDVAGMVCFMLFENTVRYKINLTDHAFWGGVNSFDYCLEFRDYGASVSNLFRGIPAEKIIKLPFYPYINENIPFAGLPFDEGKRFIFTGGSLYKTIGDGNIYYKIVTELLEKFPDLLFLYAGSGDESGIRQLQEKFGDRIYHIKERPDFFRVIERCTIYLNSYPIIGGLMTQYAAAAGRIPLTINHEGRAEGFLLDGDDEVPIYNSERELLDEAEKLLSDENYLAERNKKVSQLVISPEQFRSELKEIMTNHKSGYPANIKQVETEAIKKEHEYAFKPLYIPQSIARPAHKSLAVHFPFLFIKHGFGKVSSTLKRKFGK